jgi:hypothetical protein
MIYRVPGFLAVVLFGSTPTPSCQQVASLSQSSCVLPQTERGGERVSVEPNHLPQESLALYK